MNTPEAIASLAVFTTMDPVGPMLRAGASIRRTVREPEAGDPSVGDRTDTYTLLSGLYGPAPQFQTGTAPYEELGSGRIRFRDGEPVVQSEPDLRYAIVVPTSEMPATGFPIVADPLSGLRTGRHDRSMVISRGDQLARPGPWIERHLPDLVIRTGAMPTSAPVVNLIARVRPELVVLDRDAGWRESALVPATTGLGDRVCAQSRSSLIRAALPTRSRR